MGEFTNYGPKLTSYECFRYIFKKNTLELNQNLQDLKWKIYYTIFYHLSGIHRERQNHFK